MGNASTHHGLVAQGDPTWMNDAACSQASPGVMFPAAIDDQRDVAAGYCARCPAREHCLEYALVNRLDHGVWGGKTEKDRRDILRALKAATNG